MSDNPNEKIETTHSTLRRTSRRILYIAIAGICSVVIGVWLRSAFTSASAATVQEETRYFPAGQPVAPSLNSVPGTLQYVQNVPSYTSSQNTLQESPAPGLTYAPNQPLLQSQPQAPEENDATIEINQIRNELRSATGEQKKQLSERLTDAVGKLFDIRHAAQAKQVEKLEAELAEAKELHKKRGNRKAEIIERRIADLLQSADDLAWNRDLAAQPSTTNNHADINSVKRTFEEIDSSLRNMWPNRGSSTAPAEIQTWRVPDPNSGYRTPTYRADPNYSPGTSYPNPVPQSSTPPQFIPLNTQDSGQASLLQSVPSANSTNSAPAMPKLSSNSTSSQLNESVFETRTMPQDAVKLTEPLKDASSEQLSKPTDRLDVTSLISKTVIEAAYDYEEALDVAIETKSLYKKGVAGMREFSNSKRNAAKAKAIWAGTCRDLAERSRILEIELKGKLELLNQNAIAKRAEHALEFGVERLKSECQSLGETLAWTEEFKKQSLAALEKKFEQSEEEKKAEEKKPEAPSEKVEIASPDAGVYNQ